MSVDFFPAELIPVSSTLSADDLRLGMGMPAGTPLKKRLQRHVTNTLTALTQHARPQLVWRIGGPKAILGRVPLSRHLERFLECAELAAVMVGSAGESWNQVTFQERDPMAAYVQSVAATALARSTLVQARKELARRHPGLEVSVPLSPGNAGLPLVLQRGIASLLPLREIGIGFDADSLMLTPLASVSAFCRLYKQAKPASSEESLMMPYCDSCNSRHCQIRIGPYVPGGSLASQP